AADEATPPVSGETTGGRSPSKATTDTNSPPPAATPTQPVPQYVSTPARQSGPPAPMEEQIAMTMMVPLKPPATNPAAPLAPSPPVSPAAARPAPPSAAIQQPEMLFLPGGQFQMGSREDPSEEPAHFVQVRPFWIGKYPVTVGEWRACVAAGGCKD